MDKSLTILVAFAFVAILLFAAGCAGNSRGFGSMISATACKDAGGKVVNTSVTSYMDCTGGRKKIGDVKGSTQEDLLICCV